MAEVLKVAHTVDGERDRGFFVQREGGLPGCPKARHPGQQNEGGNSEENSGDNAEVNSEVAWLRLSIGDGFAVVAAVVFGAFEGSGLGIDGDAFAVGPVVFAELDLVAELGEGLG